MSDCGSNQSSILAHKARFVPWFGMTATSQINGYDNRLQVQSVIIITVTILLESVTVLHTLLLLQVQSTLC